VSNFEKHIGYINNYNESFKSKARGMCQARGIDERRLHPKNIKGNEKWIGMWDDDGFYSKFKTLGAKRYLVCDASDGSIHMTVSGVAKNGVGFLCRTFGCGYEQSGKYYADDVDSLFDAFNDGMEIPPGACGKNIHTYIDEPFTCQIRDYQGHETEIHEESCVNLEETGYLLKISDEYDKLIKSIFTQERGVA